MIEQLKNLLYVFSLNGLKDRTDLELIRKIRLLNLSSLTAITILLVMGCVAFAESRLLLGVLDISASMILISLLLYMGKSGRYDIASQIGVYFMEVFLFYFLFSGGSGNTGHLWSFTLPLFACFLLGASRGITASMIYVGAAAAIFLIQPSIAADYPGEFKIRFFFSFFISSIFAYHFENLRIIINRKLERKNQELMIEKEKADEASQTKTDFLTNMSHELRTPLNHVIGFGQLIKDQQIGPLNEVQSEYMEDILESSNHLLSLINDILDLSKVEAGKVKLELAETDLISLMKKALAMFQEKASEKKIRLMHQDTAEGLPAQVDPRRITQVLYNLLSNALKFTPANGTITLSSVAANNEVRISVKDTGIGIEKKNLHKIFKSFEQVESRTNRRYQGTGLGLALSKKLIELHGGSIWAESDGEGKGAQFIFTLPVMAMNLKEK